MLHHGNRSDAAQGRTERDVESHLLVWRPANVKIGTVGDGLQNLGARRSRVADGNQDPGFDRSLGYGFVARKQHA
jgi:hypothetical protein